MAAVAPPKSNHPGGSVKRIAFSQKLSHWDVKISPYLYISPFFIIFAIVGLFPLVYTAYVSVHEWHLIGGQGAFVGLKNFSDVLSAPLFWRGLRNTFSIFLMSSVPQVFLGLVLAYMLDTNLRAKTFWRMGILLPYVVAPVAVGLIFSKLFAEKSGMINAVLEAVGMSPIAWQSGVFASHFAISTMVNFRWTGYTTLILLAAMQAVPRDVYEAAAIDGAGRVRTFFSVTIPMVRPTLIFVVITSTIGGLQVFDEPRMYDTSGQGGADRQWMTVTMYLYELGWGAQKSFGRASAVALILFLIIITFGMINFALTRRISATDSNRGGN
jgi:cellobiose transport system permease protein